MTMTTDLRDAITEAAADTAGITQPDTGLALHSLSLARLHPDPRNRGGHEVQDDEKTRELAASIREVGVLQPILVRIRQDGDWDIIAGHRRWKASQMAGLAAAPCLVRDVDDPAAVVERLIENLHREDLKPLEEAAGFKELVDLKMSQRQIAARVGCSQPHVARRLQLLELPELVQDAFVEGKLTIDEARALRPLREHPVRLKDVIDRSSGPGYSPGVESLVARHVDDIDRATRIEDIKARVLADGKQWLDPAKAYNDGHSLTGWKLSSVVKVAAHRPLKCHGYSATAHGDVVELEVCMTPDVHIHGEAISAGGAAVKETAAQKKARLAEEKRLAEAAEQAAREKAAREQRLEQITKTLTGKRSAKAEAATVDFILAGLFELALEQQVDEATMLLLGFDVENEERSYEALLLELVQQRGRAGVVAVLAAVAVGDSVESRWRYVSDEVKQRTDAAYDEWLQAIGAQPPERDS